MQIRGVIQQVEGQRFIGAIAGFGQQFFRFFVAFFLRPGKPFRLAQLRAIGVRRRVAVGRQIALSFHLISNNIAIQTQLQRGTHAHVGERGLLVVDFVIIGTQIGVNVQLVGDLFFQLLEEFDRQLVISHVQFTAAVAVNIGHFGRGRQPGNGVNDGFSIIPIVRVTLHHDPLVDHPVFQSIRAVGNDIARLRPLIAKFFDGRFVDGRHRRVNQQFIKIGYRFAEGDFQRVVVNGFYAQLARRFLAVNDFVDVNDMTILRIAGIRRSCFRIHQTLPAVYEVLGGNRLAVRPFCIFTQMEGPDFKIFIIPALRHARDRVAIFRRSIQQTFEQVAANIGLWHPFDFIWVQRLRLGAAITYQGLLLCQLHSSRDIRCHCHIAGDQCG